MSHHGSRNPNQDQSWYQGLGYCCDCSDPDFFWRNLDFGDFGLENQLDTLRVWWVILVGACRTVVLKAVWIRGPGWRDFRGEECGLDIILMTFWWRMWQLVQKNLPVAKLKLPALAEISRQPTIDCIAWLLVAGLMQICNEKEQVEEEKQYKMYCLRKRGH